LQFLALSKRLLRLDEAIDAIAVAIEPTLRFDLHDRIDNLGDIRRLCSSLIALQDEYAAKRGTDESLLEDGQHSIPPNEITVQLSHFSVKEYLLSTDVHKEGSHFAPQVANAQVAKVSLAYLTNLDHDLTTAQIVQQFPLSAFAARYWASFCVQAGPNDDLLNKLSIQVLEYGSKNYYTWLHLYDPDEHWNAKPWIDQEECRRRTVINPLYFAAMLGLLPALQYILKRGADVNAQGGEYGNALQAASYRGHAEIVQLLLNKGANVNAQGGEYGNTLYDASYRGDVKIVQLLLDKGAEVNAQGGEYGNALQAASYRSHVEIVGLLLDKGADVNAQGGKYGNALYAASEYGHAEVVGLLLDKGAEVNAQGGKYGNALQAASTRGHAEVVGLVLDKGAEVNAQGGEYGNALQAASYRGHAEIVQLLLNKGAHVNAQGGEYGNTLHDASYRGGLSGLRAGVPCPHLPALRLRGLADQPASVFPFNARGATVDAVARWPAACGPDEFLFPAAVIPRLPQLPLYTDGLQCQLAPATCRQICRGIDQMRGHWREAHSFVPGKQQDGSRVPDRATLVARRSAAAQPMCCQKFFRTRRYSNCFAVHPASDEDASPAGSAALTWGTSVAERVLGELARVEASRAAGTVRASRHADEHGQPGVDVAEPEAMGRGGAAVCAGDGDEDEGARGGAS
jgi:ankyrin repeat protein